MTLKMPKHSAFIEDEQYLHTYPIIYVMEYYHWCTGFEMDVSTSEGHQSWQRNHNMVKFCIGLLAGGKNPTDLFNWAEVVETGIWCIRDLEYFPDLKRAVALSDKKDRIPAKYLNEEQK